MNSNLYNGMTDREYEQTFERYRKLGQMLGLMVPKAVYTLRVDNPDGSVIKRSSLSHSWVRNAYNWMFTQLGGVDAGDATYESGKLSFKTPDGGISYNYQGYIVSPGTVSGGYQRVAGSDDRGILVGTDDTAESFEGYKILALIAHGNDPGQFSYNACAYTKSWNGGALEMTNTFERIFNNNSGGTIAVAEIGIAGYLKISAISAVSVLVIRDLVSPAVDVVDAAQLTVSYDIILTYPE